MRVFNSDFIADNLNFAGSHFKPILLLGSESEAAQKEIERCEAMHKRATELAAAFAKESGDAAKPLSSVKTTSSAHIKKTVGLVAAFGCTQLEAELRTVALALSEHTLSEQAFNNDIRLAHTSATENLPPITKVSVDLTLGALAAEASKLLARKPDLSNTMDHLVSNPPIEAWVQSGLHLHEGKTEPD